MAAKLQLTVNATDILNIRGYGSVDSGHTLGSVEVKLTLTDVELQMKIDIVANHLQPEDILIGKDVTENPGLIGITKQGKWWFFRHIEDGDILPKMEEEKITLRAQYVTVIPPQSRGMCRVYTTDARPQTVFIEGGFRGEMTQNHSVPSCVTYTVGTVSYTHLTLPTIYSV